MSKIHGVVKIDFFIINVKMEYEITHAIFGDVNIPANFKFTIYCGYVPNGDNDVSLEVGYAKRLSVETFRKLFSSQTSELEYEFVSILVEMLEHAGYEKAKIFADNLRGICFDYFVITKRYILHTDDGLRRTVDKPAIGSYHKQMIIRTNRIDYVGIQVQNIMEMFKVEKIEKNMYKVLNL